MDDLVVLYTTWPSADTAEAAGRQAVEKSLAACANVLAPMRSIYRWEGALQTETETPMLLKTSREGAAALKDFILAIHPYDTPCILALPIWPDGSNPDYVGWATSQVS